MKAQTPDEVVLLSWATETSERADRTLKQSREKGLGEAKPESQRKKAQAAEKPAKEESKSESDTKQVRRDGSIKELVEGKKYKLRIYVGRTEAGSVNTFVKCFAAPPPRPGRVSANWQRILTTVSCRPGCCLSR